MPDSPENKCPTCDGDGSAWCGLGINPHLAPCPACGGSGRVNTSGGEAGSREARNESRSSTTSGLIHTSPSVDPQCPDCGETIIGDWFGRKTEVPCGCSPVDSGTGTDENGDARIEGKTIACSDFVDDGYLLCLAFTDGSEAQIERESDRPITIRWTRASVPSSPHETGQKLPTSEEEFAAALLVSFEQGKVAGRRLGEGRLSPSAAPTNSGPSRSDSEGEGLAARVERLAERMTGLARKQADEFGNYVSQGQFSADYKEGLASAYDDSAEALRSLLVPKEEA